MVYLIRILFLIILLGFIQSCVSPKMSQELQQGKLTFENGQFKQAFRQLLPIAVDGKPEAQYAVGYMYYYGYGVPEDVESGLFWMQKAADQHYLPAMKALGMIQQPVSPAPEKTVYREIPVTVAPTPSPPPSVKKVALLKDDQDEVLKSLPRQTEPLQFAAPAQTAAQTVAKPVKVALSTQAVSSQDNYSLQLFGSYTLADVKALKQKLSLANNARIWHTEHNGSDWYVLTYGHYASTHDAMLAKNELSSELQEMHPWIRNTNSLDRV